MFYSFLIHFSADGHLGCFHVLATVDSPALHFGNIDSLVLSLLYGPSLTSIPDYWKNHSFNYMDLYFDCTDEIDNSLLVTCTHNPNIL